MLPRKDWRIRGLPRLVLLVLLGVAMSCGSVPDDPGPRLFPAGGVIRGAILYRGPRPCSRAGHIVGNAVVLVFDRNSPPPPRGVASAPVNFTDVVGDALFANEPRYSGPETYCPNEHGFGETISTSAPYDVGPLPAGSFEVHAFFDWTGNFLPSFKIRNLPERGDVTGGHVTGASLGSGPSTARDFLPVNVGVRGGSLAGGASPTATGLVIPAAGFVADGVTVTIDAPVETTRPYFFAQGLSARFDPAAGALSSMIVQSSEAPASDLTSLEGTTEVDPNYAPVLTIPQDIEVLAPPQTTTPASASYLESSFPHLRLQWGVAAGELGAATAPPFSMQIAALGQGPQAAAAGFSVGGEAALDPETGAPTPRLIPEGRLPALWPMVVLTKLMSDPTHQSDPASLVAQGSPAEPVVVLQAITLLGSRDPSRADSLLETSLSAGSLLDAAGRPNTADQDHLTVLLRPMALCFAAQPNPLDADPRGTLVTPHLTGTAADVDCTSGACLPSGGTDQPLAPASLLDSPPLASLVKGTVVQGCLPAGRYAINVVYPGGQTWTVPNEAGACSGSEGGTDYARLTCSIKPRPVLYSQGNRAVVEIVPSRDPAYCLAHPVPAVCGGR
ncbi:MAG: hypothetical protein M3O36_14345 [Myxococcota bacterium]|nr:hypothetical protein [Myxococcota bacterium]